MTKCLCTGCVISRSGHGYQPCHMNGENSMVKLNGITAQELRNCKSGMFSERKGVDAAIKYAQTMFPKSDHAAITTALMVYHNTLLEGLAKQVDKGEL